MWNSINCKSALAKVTMVTILAITSLLADAHDCNWQSICPDVQCAQSQCYPLGEKGTVYHCDSSGGANHCCECTGTEYYCKTAEGQSCASTFIDWQVHSHVEANGCVGNRCGPV